jgi:hypothetical protein
MKTLFFVVANGLALALLAGCGGTSGGGDGESCPAGATLTLFQTQMTVKAGDPAVPNIGANLTGCTVMVQWTLTGPGSINPTSGVPIAYTPPASVPSTTSATLTATADGLPPVSIAITINP